MVYNLPMSYSRCKTLFYTTLCRTSTNTLVSEEESVEDALDTQLDEFSVVEERDGVGDVASEVELHSELDIRDSAMIAISDL